MTSELGDEASVSRTPAPREVSVWTPPAVWSGLPGSLLPGPSRCRSLVPELRCVDCSFLGAPPFRRHSFAESELTTSPSASHLPKFLLMFLDQGVSYHPPYFAFNRVSGGIMGKNA